jgi:hypothetical protein
MTISVWRYSHLALAVSSFLFLAVASLTGIILAIEPINQKLSDYRVKDFNQVSVAQTIGTLKKTYPGITDISVDVNGFVKSYLPVLIPARVRYWVHPTSKADSSNGLLRCIALFSCMKPAAHLWA